MSGRTFTLDELRGMSRARLRELTPEIRRAVHATTEQLRADVLREAAEHDERAQQLRDQVIERGR